MGWETLRNGELLEAAEEARFDVLLTADQKLRYQQNLTGRALAIVELPDNRLRLVRRYAPEVIAALASIQPGGYIAIPAQSL